MGIIKLKNKAEEAKETMIVEEPMVDETIVEEQKGVDAQEESVEVYDDPAVLYEDEARTDENSHHYFLNNGTAKTVIHAESVRFFDEEEKLNDLKKAIKNVAALAQQYSNDDYERIIFVHDYLIKNAIYDHDALNEYEKASHSPSCEYIFSSYGCLVNGKTVCSGYAKAFQLIMREMGYDSTYVVGDAGERHGWNCVYLDGEGRETLME